MPSILPSSLQMAINQTQQFAASGIGSPVWSLTGSGVLTQTGLFTASASGESIIVAHEAAWDSVDTGVWSRQADDSLISNGGINYFNSAISKGKLNSVGDWCKAKLPFLGGFSPNKWGIFNIANTRGVYLDTGPWIREVASGYSVATSITAAVGDVFEFRLNGANKIEVSRNGTSIFTSVNSFNGLNLPFYTSCDYSSGVRQLVPRFNSDNAAYSSVEAVVEVLPDVLLPRDGCELYIDANLETYSNGANVATAKDFSLKNRNLTALSTFPTFATNVVNSKAVYRFSGNQNPLKNAASFNIVCGWMVVKHDLATFPSGSDGYEGFLTDCNTGGILVGEAATSRFFDFMNPSFEIRSNDSIKESSNAPAPMQEFRLIFFRFWKGGIILNGVQIGQDRLDTARQLDGDVAFLALYSRDFCESDIRKYSKSVADYFGLTLADVFPYVADSASPQVVSKKILRSGNDIFGKTSRVKRGKKRLQTLSFTTRTQSEKDAAEAFWDDHHPEVEFVVRSYANIPPRDTTVFTTNDGFNENDRAINLWDYGLEVKEK
jgi:hypothetical protein